MHFGENIYPGRQRKPEIITAYNKPKVLVDKVDEMVEKYSFSRICMRWLL
jgi:hypothetical protein